MISALFAAVAIALAAIFLLAPDGPALTPVLTAWHLVAAILGFLGLVLVCERHRSGVRRGHLTIPPGVLCLHG